MSKIPIVDLNYFDYELPKEKIADFPLENREDSKLLFFDSNTNTLEHLKFRNVSNLIDADSLLVMNNTKVIAARIPVIKTTGGKAEILCIEPTSPSIDPQIVMNTKNTCEWKCIIGGRNIKNDDILFTQNNDMQAKILEKKDNIAHVQFTWSGISFAEILNNIGKIPLPPYIKRDATEFDTIRYQTIYAKSEGSVAAPTAGLHFSPEIINELKNKNVTITELILHVGPGTFLPIETDNISTHNMHYEQFFISKNSLNQIYTAIKSKKSIVATGTTSIRTLESAYILGAKLINNKIDLNNMNVTQEDAYHLYEKPSLPSAEEAIYAILEKMSKQNIEQIHGKTQLFIVPNFKFQITDKLITNFHLPKSTLLLLVGAFIGSANYKKVYQSALANNYRFLSYGDSSLLIRKKN